MSKAGGGYARFVSFEKFYESKDCFNDRGTPDETAWKHNLMCGGTITVVERLTGFGWWDIETGYRSPCGGFWLASGSCDIRDELDTFDTEEGMIQWVITRSGNCTGQRRGWRTFIQCPPNLLANAGTIHRPQGVAG